MFKLGHLSHCCSRNRASPGYKNSFGLKNLQIFFCVRAEASHFSPLKTRCASEVFRMISLRAYSRPPDSKSFCWSFRPTQPQCPRFPILELSSISKTPGGGRLVETTKVGLMPFVFDDGCLPAPMQAAFKERGLLPLIRAIKAVQAASRKVSRVEVAPTDNILVT